MGLNRRIVSVKEKKLQALLASDLSIIEPGLKLIDTEFYLKAHEYGTKGFIDILAQDENGNYVIIEIKSQKSSTREAIHELFKYEEYLKHLYSMNSEEIRLLLVATDWDELLIPFSSIYSQTTSNLEGYRCILSSDDNKIKAVKRVSPLALVDGRMFNETQLLIWCKNKDSVESCVAKVQDVFQKNCYDKFFLIVCEAPPGFEEQEISVLKSLHAQSAQDGRQNSLLKEYKSPQYFVNIVTLKEERRKLEQIVQKDQILLKSVFEDGYSEISEIVDYYLVDKALYFYLWRSIDLSCDIELGAPEKLYHRIEMEQWKVQTLIRGNHFSKGQFLSDKLLISEAMSGGGTDNRKETITFSYNNRASIKKTYKIICQKLEGKAYWRYPILEQLNGLGFSKMKYYGQYTYYDPMSVLRYLYLSYIDNNPVSLLPKTKLIIWEYNRNELELTMTSLYGIYMKTKPSKTFEYIINHYYDGNVIDLRLSSTFDGYREDNVLLAHDLGFELCVIKETIVNPFTLENADGKLVTNERLNSLPSYELFNWNTARYEKIEPLVDIYELSYPAFYKQETIFMEKLIKSLEGIEQAMFMA